MLNSVDAEFAEDLALASAAGTGDPRASRILAERVYERVRTSVRYLAGWHRDVDDMIQMGLIEVLRSAGSYRGECRLERWVDRVVVRVAMRMIKQRKLRDQVVSLSEDHHSSVTADQEEQAAVRQLRRRLADMMARLPLERRTVVMLHWVHGYTVYEIAELTNAPVNTVRDRLRKGKSLIRKQMLRDPVLRDWAENRYHES